MKWLKLQEQNTIIDFEKVRIPKQWITPYKTIYKYKENESNTIIMIK